MKKLSVLLLILTALLTAAPASPVFAQAYRSQIKFLEEFAAGQYARGDKESAMKHFGWILRIDPNNAVAREYLKRFEEETKGAGASSTLTPEHMNQIISDISSVSGNLAGYEKDARELTRMIRDLITENDALYQALYKRSREVIELRHKFYGTPYEEAYVKAMASLPIDRVPQRLHPSNDILPDDTLTPAAQKQRNDAVRQDLASLSKKQTSAAAGPQTKQAPNATVQSVPVKAKQPASSKTAAAKNAPVKEQLDSALAAKRDMLVEKTMATAEKIDNLTKLKDELVDINAKLKQTNNRYIEAIDKIDAYYLRIKENLAKKNYVEQKMFSALVTDYAGKLREIEKLKQDIRTQDNTLPSFKPVIESSNTRLRGIDEELKAKDEEVAKFKAMLVEYKKQLNERDAKLMKRGAAIRDRETTIQRQQNDMALTSQKLDNVSAQVTGIEKELKDSDAQISKLKANVARSKGIMPVDDQGIPLQRKLELQAQHIKDLETQNAAIAAFLKKNEQALAAAASHIKSLEQQLVALGQDLQRPLIPVHDPEKKGLREELSRLKTENMLAKQDVIATTASLNSLTIREQKLLVKVKNYTNLLQKTAALEQKLQTLKDDNAAMRDALAKMKALEQDNAALRAAAAQYAAIDNENADLKKKLIEAADKLKETADQLTARSNALAEAEEDVRILIENTRIKDERIEGLSQRAAVLLHEQRTLHPITRAEDNTAEQDLEKRLRSAYEKLTAAETLATNAASQTAKLKEQLARRDAKIEELTSAESIKGNADKKALMEALVAKDEELTAVKEQLSAAQQANDSLKKNSIAGKVQEEALTLTELKAANKDLASANQNLQDRVKALQEHISASATPSVDQNALRKLSLDLEEKDSRIKALQQDLDTARGAQKAAEAGIKDAQEKYAAMGIKQEAIEKIVNDRGNKIAELVTEIKALRDELTAEKKAREEDQARIDDAASAKTLAENTIASNAREVTRMQGTIKDLLVDIKAAKAMVLKKERDHDATLKELRRLSDLLDKKKEEVNTLQRRVDGSIKKSPSDDEPDKNTGTSAPDCFENCVQK